MTSDTARPLGKIQPIRWQTPSLAIPFNLEVTTRRASGTPVVNVLSCRRVLGTDIDPPRRGGRTEFRYGSHLKKKSDLYLIWYPGHAGLKKSQIAV